MPTEIKRWTESEYVAMTQVALPGVDTPDWYLAHQRIPYGAWGMAKLVSYANPALVSVAVQQPRTSVWPVLEQASTAAARLDLLDVWYEDARNALAQHGLLQLAQGRLAQSRRYLLEMIEDPDDNVACTADDLARINAALADSGHA